jgi:hypothetical protein
VANLRAMRCDQIQGFYLFETATQRGSGGTRSDEPCVAGAQMKYWFLVRKSAMARKPLLRPFEPQELAYDLDGVNLCIRKLGRDPGLQGLCLRSGR